MSFILLLLTAALTGTRAYFLTAEIDPCNPNPCDKDQTCIQCIDKPCDSPFECVNKPEEVQDIIVSGKCGPFEYFNACSGCELKCINDTIQMNRKKCLRRVCIMPGRCRCSDGYARTPSGECIQHQLCRPRATREKFLNDEKNVCGKNEVFVWCGGCDITCTEILEGKIKKCDKNPFCLEPGECLCAKYHARAPNGLCVPSEQCEVTQAPKDPCEPNPCKEPCRTKCLPNKLPCLGRKCTTFICSDSCPKPSGLLTCPEDYDDTFTFCLDLCLSDDDCPTGQLCCSNGCGRSCRIPQIDEVVPGEMLKV